MEAAVTQSVRDISLSDDKTGAVGTLLLYTGLRGCDIAGLLFQSVDWDQEILYIVQRKTADILRRIPLNLI